MNHVERTSLVPQAFQVNAANPDRRRRHRGEKAFDLEAANAPAEPVAARVEVTPERTLSPGGDEGVGELVNIVV